MDTYQTEEEQVAAIKRFVGDHGSKLLAVIVLFIAAILGYQGYYANQKANQEAASMYFSNMLEQTAQLAPGVAKLEESKQVQLDAAYTSLVTDHANSMYAVYANLLQAKLAVTNKDLDAAAKYLQWILSANTTDEMKALANLRLGQLLFAKDDLDAALAIATLHSTPFERQYYTLEGDVLVAKGEQAQALAAYKKAEAAGDSELAQDPLLSLKIETLTPVDADKLVTNGQAEPAAESAPDTK